MRKVRCAWCWWSILSPMVFVRPRTSCLNLVFIFLLFMWFTFVIQFTSYWDHLNPKPLLLNSISIKASHISMDSSSSSIAQGPDDDVKLPDHHFAQFGAGCFWGVELAFQRVPGVTKTEVGYSQGLLHNPTYHDVCKGTTNHSEVVRVLYDPKECSYESLLNVFWSRHDPTSLNRQGNDVGTQYRSGIYFYTPEQEKAAHNSIEQQQKLLNRKIVTEILPAKKFYRAEEYHQQYLAKGGRSGLNKQSAEKGCNDPIRCYG